MIDLMIWSLAIAMGGDAALHRPAPNSAEYEEAKTYFVKWAAPTMVSLPLEICDWSPGRKIAAVEVPQATLFAVVREPVLLVEEAGKQRKIRMKTIGVAVNPEEQSDLNRVLKLCAGS